MIMSEHLPATHHALLARVPGGRVLTLILATLSWRYVETPFRSGPRRPSRRKLFTLAGAAAAALAVLGLTGTLSQGLPGRFPAHSAAHRRLSRLRLGEQGLFPPGKLLPRHGARLPALPRRRLHPRGRQAAQRPHPRRQPCGPSLVRPVAGLPRNQFPAGDIAPLQAHPGAAALGHAGLPARDELSSSRISCSITRSTG